MESVLFRFLRWAKQLEVDTIAPMALVLSLFFPFYVSVVTVGAVAVMTMVNYRMRTRALESPYGKLLMGVLIAPFFVWGCFIACWFWLQLSVPSICGVS